jgi:predicted phage terminase large subunit-like protein
MPVLGWSERLARRYDPAPTDRRWPTPGAMAQHLDPTVRQTPALRAIDDLLVDVAARPGARAMVLMPPQEGKTQRASVAFPTWLLADDRNLRVAVVSFGDDRAREIGQDIRDNVTNHPELEIRLRADSKAKGRWKIDGWRGGVYCTGVGGSLTGQPVDVLIIDDPIQDLDHAISPVYRERARRFWQGTAVPRLAPHSRVVLIQTRWHEDDLAGWLLSSNPQPWRVLSIPAVAESSDDALRRPVGEAMTSSRGQRDWDAVRKDVGEYAWAAMYQQRPAPAEGGLFKRDDWRHWTLAGHGGMETVAVDGQAWQLSDCDRFITADLAISKKTRADFTVFAAWAITPNGDLVLLDLFRGRIEEADHFAKCLPLIERWRIPVVHVEASQHSTTMAYEAGRAGIPIGKLEADRDKFTRALPAATRVEQHRVFLPRADWVGDWIDEHAGFPHGAHDDQVDVLAYAERVRGAHWLPPRSPQRASRGEQVDFMTVAY